MAILKTYGRQVQTSADSGTGRAIDTGASQAWGAVGQAVGTVAGVVGEVKRRNDNISTMTGRAEYDLGVQAMNEKISQKVQTLSQADEEYTPEQLFSETQQIRDDFANDFDTRISPSIKNPEVMANMRASMTAANGQYGADALGASYLKHRTAHNITKLEVNGAKLIDAGRFDLAMKNLDAVKDDLGTDAHMVMAEKYRKMQSTSELDKEISGADSVYSQYQDGSLDWKSAYDLLNEKAGQVDGNEFMSGGQKLSAKNAYKGKAKEIERGAQQAARGFMSTITKGALDGEDVSAEINVNGDFIESVYGKGIVKAMTSLNTAPALAGMLSEGTEENRDATRKALLKKLNDERSPIYKQIADVTGWLTIGKSFNSANSVINDISKSGLSREEQSVLMEYVLDEAAPRTYKEDKSHLTDKKMFRSLLESYNEAVVASGDNNVYTNMIPDWLEVLDKAGEAGAKREDVVKLVDDKKKKVSSDANAVRVRNINMASLTGTARRAVIGDKAVVRTGTTKDGRKVVEYSDGTREYAD